MRVEAGERTILRSGGDVTIILAAVKAGRSKHDLAAELTDVYVARAGKYMPCESVLVESEKALLALLERRQGRVATFAVLLDSGGKTLTSNQIANEFGRLRDTGVQRLLLAIGPADGWSAAARERADMMLSLGRITLPHELARLVLAEQVYRALTILAGHPYHCGH